MILASVESILDDEIEDLKKDFNQKDGIYKRVKMTTTLFLERLNLSKYLLNFMTNGFDDVNFLVSFFF
jgi:hypothetical protein